MLSGESLELMSQVAPAAAYSATMSRPFHESSGMRLTDDDVERGVRLAVRRTYATIARTSSGERASNASDVCSLIGKMPSQRAARRTGARFGHMAAHQTGIRGCCTGFGRNVASLDVVVPPVEGKLLAGPEAVEHGEPFIELLAARSVVRFLAERRELLVRREAESDAEDQPCRSRADRPSPSRARASTDGVGRRGVTIAPMRMRSVARAIAASATQGSAMGCWVQWMWSQMKNPSQPAASASRASAARRRTSENSPKLGMVTAKRMNPSLATDLTLMATDGTRSTQGQSRVVDACTPSYSQECHRHLAVRANRRTFGPAKFGGVKMTEEEIAALQEELAEARAELERIEAAAADREARAATLEAELAQARDGIARLAGEAQSREETLAEQARASAARYRELALEQAPELPRRAGGRRVDR